jgi:hypothetical protein
MREMLEPKKLLKIKWVSRLEQIKETTPKHDQQLNPSSLCYYDSPLEEAMKTNNLRLC